MIKVMKFDGNTIVINADMIETVECTPDTVISLTTKNKILVKESIDEVIAKVLEYKQQVHKFPEQSGSNN